MLFLKLFAIYTVCFFGFALKVGQAKFFEYDHSHNHEDQENWTGTCKTGKRQSPIDIKSEYTNAIRQKHHTLRFNGYTKQVDASIKNNGHTVQVTFTNGADKEIWVKDQKLSASKYEFQQAHFHWGDDDTQGSEHKIDGKSFPMEMHLVHWNLDVANTMQEAVKKDTGISLEVLGVHFEIGNRNEKFQNLFNAVAKVSKHNATVRIKGGIRLNDLLPQNKDAFYRYEGSLTTPGCNEIVMWTIFKEKIEIDSEQMETMRKVTYRHDHEDSLMYNNFREVKLEHGRKIYDVDIEHENDLNDDNDTSGGISRDKFLRRRTVVECILFIIFQYLVYIF